MSVFVKRARGVGSEERLRRELQNSIDAEKILGEKAPRGVLSPHKNELKFNYLGAREEFLDKRLTENDHLIGAALGQLAESIALLHSHTSESDASPERAPVVPLSVDQLDSMSEAVARFICRTDDQSILIRSLLNNESTSRLSFIHGDLTLDNIHLNSQSGRISIVDWELSGAGAKEEDLSSLFSSIISLKVLKLAEPELDPSKFATGLLDAYRLVVNFLETYKKFMKTSVDSNLLDALFREKIKCRTILALHMFGEKSLQFRLLESVSQKLQINDIVTVVDFARKG